MKRKFLFGLTSLIAPTIYMNADGGAGNGGTGSTGSTGDGSTVGGAGDGSSGDGSTGDGEGDKGSEGDKSFTQAELNKIVNDRLARERKKYEGVDIEEYKNLKKAKDDEEEANKTDLQKANDKLAKAEKEKESAIALANTRLILAEFKVLAKDNNIEYIDDAYKLADLSSVTVGDDGTVEGLKEIIESLVADKPFLVGTTSNGGTGVIDKKANKDKGKDKGTSIGQRLAKNRANANGKEITNNYFK